MAERSREAFALCPPRRPFHQRYHFGEATPSSPQHLQRIHASLAADLNTTGAHRVLRAHRHPLRLRQLRVVSRTEPPAILRLPLLIQLGEVCEVPLRVPVRVSMSDMSHGRQIKGQGFETSWSTMQMKWDDSLNGQRTGGLVGAPRPPAMARGAIRIHPPGRSLQRAKHAPAPILPDVHSKRITSFRLAGEDLEWSSPLLAPLRFRQPRAVPQTTLPLGSHLGSRPLFVRPLCVFNELAPLRAISPALFWW